jgi:hypothetical protein
MDIDVLPLADHAWSVRIKEGADTDGTTHRIDVDAALLDSLGVTDESMFVREAVLTYLDHGPGTSLPHDVTLDWLQGNVDGFFDELTARLS